MANLYTIDAHPLLSQEAKTLGVDTLEAHARVAETMLGLLNFTAFDPVTDPDKYARATDAVALQVSYQVEAGMDAFVLSSHTRGGRTLTYRGAGVRRMPTIHSLAKKIVSQIKPKTSTTTR